METRNDKISYIIGRQIGADFRAQGIEINHSIFAESVLASLSGEESLLAPEETQEIMQTFQEEMQAKVAEQTAALGTKNAAAGVAYLEENEKKEGVVVTASGLQYRVITKGEGKSPVSSSTVETHYEGTLIDGTIFDSSYQRGQTASFPVNGVIPGWTEALQLMKEGDVWELTIPSELAYGANGAGAAIGPNAVLKFKIELIKVL